MEIKLIEYSKQEKEFIENAIKVHNIPEDILNNVIESVIATRYSPIMDLRGWIKISETHRKLCIENCISFILVDRIPEKKLPNIAFNDIEIKLIEDFHEISKISKEKIIHYIANVAHSRSPIIDVMGWLGILDTDRINIINDVIGYLKVKREYKKLKST